MFIFMVLFIKKLNFKTPLIMGTNLVEIFYIVDEFCKEIEKTMQGRLLPNATSKKKRKQWILLVLRTKYEYRRRKKTVFSTKRTKATPD